MKRFLSLVVLSIVLLSGCDRPAKEKTVVDKHWPVELCFEEEEYKMYRFSDGYHWRYFVIMKNGSRAEVINPIKKGKNSVEMQNLPTTNEQFEQ